MGMAARPSIRTLLRRASSGNNLVLVRTVTSMTSPWRLAVTIDAAGACARAVDRARLSSPYRAPHTAPLRAAIRAASPVETTLAVLMATAATTTTTADPSASTSSRAEPRSSGGEHDLSVGTDPDRERPEVGAGRHPSEGRDGAHGGRA